MDLSLLISPNSGPLWGAIGVVFTVIANWAMSKLKSNTDMAAAQFTALNTASKQLIDGLFQQVQTLQAQVGVLSKSAEECELRHRASEARVADLSAELATMKATLPKAKKPQV